MLQIVTDRDNPSEHITQIAGDGHFLDRILDLAVLDPETTGTTE